MLTSTSLANTGSTFTSSLSPTVFSSSTRQSSPNARSSKASRLGESSQGSKISTSTKIIPASTSNRASLSISSAGDGNYSETSATFTSSYPSRSQTAASNQSCSLCMKSSVSTAARSSVSQTTSILQRSSVASDPAVSVSPAPTASGFSASSTPVVSAFYEVLSGGVTTYYNITATITSPPPGFTTIMASNSQWTGDTTTVSDGTTYPVIYGCTGCGGLHHGIVIAGLGGGPTDPKREGCRSGIFAIFRSIFGCGTGFTFPSIWGLPPFIIDPLGDPVPLAPGSETDPDPDEDPDDETSSKPQSNGPSSSRASLTPSLSRASSSTPTFSTSASSVASCSPSSTPNLYAIFLVTGITDAEVGSLSTYLQEVGGPDVVAPISLGIDDVATMFVAVIDDCVASKIDAHPSVIKPRLLLCIGSPANTTRSRLVFRIIRYR